MIIGQSGDLGDGVIDNLIVSTSVHLVFGTLVLISLSLATGLVVIDAVNNRPIQTRTQLAMGLAALVLTAQVLIGIKLLDQGQGILQLYIHYMGGLIPLGVFAIGGWFFRGDTGRSARWLAVLLAIGLFSAMMAFFIGRAYVNG
jgi:hypothetical protein